MKAMTLAMMAGLAMATTAQGQTMNWAAATSGSWGSLGNWNPMNVPDNAGENAVLGLTGPYAASIAGTAYGIGSLTISNPAATLTLDASDAIGHTALVISQSSVNDGLIRLTNQPTANNTRFQINANGIAMTGSGELRMEEAADCDFYINVGGGGFFTNGPSHKITGTGTIQGAGAILVNDGTILANLAAASGGLLVFNHTNNTGVMRATGPGAMTIGNGVVVTQSGPGAILADGAPITLNGCTIHNNAVRAIGSGLVTIGSSSATVSGITSEGNWQINASDAVGHTVLTMNVGITNNGLIRMPAQASANNARFQINSNGQTLGGTGELRMEEAADCDLYINIGGGGVFVNGASHKITGAGTIQGAGCTLTNLGTILADRTGGLAVVNHVDNKGTIRAVSPGSMTLQSGVITQTDSGFIEADNATMTLNGCTIHNNTVRSVNGGLVTIGNSSATVSGITSEGNWEINASDAVGYTVLVMNAGITNNGLIRMPAQTSANNARFQINTNGQTLGGTGELRMEEAADCDFYINIGGGGFFANGASHKITGTGTIQGAGSTLTNFGTILADRPGGMAVINHMDNRGTIRAVSPGSMTLQSGSISQADSGFIEADGTTVTLNACTIHNNTVRSVNGGLITVGPSSATISGITSEGNWEINASDAVGHTVLVMNAGITNNGLIRMTTQPSVNNARFQINANGQTLSGTGEIRMEEAADCDFYINIGGGGVFINGASHKISGVGTIQGAGCTLTNAGTLAPGAPLGTLRLFNHTALTATSVVEIEVGGDTQAQRDYLDATGANVSLGGTLKVRFRDGYVLPPCSSFVVVRGNLSGVFAAEDLPVMPQGVISVAYGTNTVTIGYIPGDLNGDAILDFADYLQFLNLFDAGDIRADLNGDGIVDFSDYLDFLNLFDAGC